MTATTAAPIDASAAGSSAPGLSWVQIIRLGLAQSALGAIVVLTTSTFNRVMMVEVQLAATIPAALVAWHYAVQMSRPHWGHQSDSGRGRTLWILGGIAILGLGAVTAAWSIGVMATSFTTGVILAVVGYGFIGAGVAAAGTSLLALMATRVAPHRRPAAAASTWIMMLVGIVATAIVAGLLLDPYTHARLVQVSLCVSVIAWLVALAAVWGVERARVTDGPASVSVDAGRAQTPFLQALRETWREPTARRFTLFVFVSMLAFNAQDLILEPFAGLVFGYEVGQSTQLSGMHQGGVLLGMLLIGAIGARTGGHDAKGLRIWMVGGCLGSAAAFVAMTLTGLLHWSSALKPVVFALGFANGVFAVAAVGAMFALASAGKRGREGMRMGVWGAAQAIAFGLGGFAGAFGYDVFKRAFGADAPAFATVFALEAVMFVASAALAARIGGAVLDGLAKAPALPTEFAAEQASMGGQR